MILKSSIWQVVKGKGRLGVNSSSLCSQACAQMIELLAQIA